MEDGSKGTEDGMGYRERVISVRDHWFDSATEFSNRSYREIERVE